MSETWTEYAVVRNGSETLGARQFLRCLDRRTAEAIRDDDPSRITVVGRQVTASGWLPVETPVVGRPVAEITGDGAI